MHTHWHTHAHKRPHTGRGGHAAMPHLNADPIVAAAAIISGMQVYASY